MIRRGHERIYIQCRHLVLPDKLTEVLTKHQEKLVQKYQISKEPFHKTKGETVVFHSSNNKEIALLLLHLCWQNIERKKIDCNERCSKMDYKWKRSLKGEGKMWESYNLTYCHPGSMMAYPSNYLETHCQARRQLNPSKLLTVLKPFWNTRGS